MSFTMNWKLMLPNHPVRFELGEPLFQAIPLASNICADLEEASVSYQKLSDNPELLRAYQEWDQGRRRFHDQKVSGGVKPNDWQKDYFQGRDPSGQATEHHMTKVQPPRVRVGTPRVESPKEASMAPEHQARQAGPATLVDRSPARPIDDEWRRWIAENLLIGQRPESILEAMTSSGFAPEDSVREINLAVESPYLKGSQLLLDRLKKRDWQLAVYRKCNRLHPGFRRDRASAQAIARRIPPRILQHQSTRHHHRHDG